MKAIIIVFDGEYLPEYGGQDTLCTKLVKTFSARSNGIEVPDRKVKVVTMTDSDIEKLLVLKTLTKTEGISCAAINQSAKIVDMIDNFCQKVLAIVGSRVLLGESVFKQAFIINLINKDELRKHPAVPYIAEITDEKIYLDRRNQLNSYKYGCLPEYINIVHNSICKLY